ncbi:MAG: BspA family leucine-rich repeat surface protein, partial [Erysipelotrichales bacterium]
SLFILVCLVSIPISAKEEKQIDNVSLSSDSTFTYGTVFNKDNFIIDINSQEEWTIKGLKEGHESNIYIPSYIIDSGNLIKINVQDLEIFNVDSLNSLKIEEVNIPNIPSSAKRKVGLEATNLNRSFSNSKATAIDLNGLDVSNVSDLSELFFESKNLEEIKVSEWETSKVTNMHATFAFVTKLSSLDIKKWKTSKVTDMSSMFNSTGVLSDLDTSNWDTGEVRDMSSMFLAARGLKEIKVRNWDTKNVETMDSMFRNATKLEILDVSNWVTDKTTNMRAMFQEDKELKNLDVSRWNTVAVEDMSWMFFKASGLTDLNVKNWKTDNVKDMNSMFHGASQLTKIDVKDWKTDNVENMRSMFQSTHSLIDLDVSLWNTQKVNDMAYMFSGAISLVDLDLLGWTTNNVTNMSYMFSSTSSIRDLDLSKWDTVKVTNMKLMFQNATSLEKINMGEKFKISEQTNIEGLLSGTTSLVDMTLSKDITNLINTKIPELKNDVYTGRWIQTDGTKKYASSQDLMDNFNGNNVGNFIREKMYNMTFIDNKTTTNIKVAPDNKLTNIPNEDGKDNHEFKGWYTKQSGSGEKFNFDNIITKDNIVLYAHYELRTCILTFSDQTKLNMVTVKYNNIIKKNEVPNIIGKKGYSFKEWNTRKDGKGNKFIPLQERITYDRVVYAVYEKDTNPKKHNNTGIAKTGINIALYSVLLGTCLISAFTIKKYLNKS